jgi:hypothetical protein
MSRRFAAASSQYYEGAFAPATTSPMTIALWFWSVSVAVAYDMMTVFEASGINYFEVGTLSSGKVFAYQSNASGNTEADTSTVAGAKCWNHLCGTIDGSGVVNAYLNGGGKVTASTGSGAPSGMTTTDIGAFNLGGTVYGPMDGMIAHACLWNVVLSDADVQRLGQARWHPLLIHPESIAAYWPLNSQTFGNELDVAPFGLGHAIQGYGIPPVAAPVPCIDNPLLYYPKRTFLQRAQQWVKGNAAFAGEEYGVSVMTRMW